MSVNWPPMQCCNITACCCTVLHTLHRHGAHQMSAFSLHLKPVSSSGAAYANVPVQSQQLWGVFKGCFSDVRASSAGHPF